VVLWKLKLQKPLALSSAEAVYYALCEAAKDVKYINGAAIYWYELNYLLLFTVIRLDILIYD
jgi:hypothetical protein